VPTPVTVEALAGTGAADRGLDPPRVPRDAGPIAIRYRLGSVHDSKLQLAIDSTSGRRVRNLEVADRAGEHLIWWDRRDDAGHVVGRGVYVVRLVADAATMARKVAILHR
jgi:hypothetical protein